MRFASLAAIACLCQDQAARYAYHDMEVHHSVSLMSSGS